MTTNPYYNNKPNRFTGVFSYVDEYSAGENSTNDVQISYDKHIAGKGNRVRKPYPEDRILVVGKKEDGVYVFAAEVISHVDGQITEAWKQKGGKTWQFNYKIRPVSSPTFLSWQQIDKISGSSKSMDKRIFQDRFQPQNDGTRITEVGTSRDRIYSHLTANF